GVELAHRLAQRVATGRAAADRVVPLAESRQQVGERLERPHHALSGREGEAQPERRDEEQERDARLGREVAGRREERGGEERAREPREERVEEDGAVVRPQRRAL